MHDSLAAAVAAASFWMFIAVAVVASAVSRVLRHRETQKTIRQAIEKGQAVDAEALDRLLQLGAPPKGPPPRGVLLFAGIMLLAIGGGLALIGVFASMTNPAQLYQGLGAGALVGMLGAGLLVANLVIRDPRGEG